MGTEPYAHAVDEIVVVVDTEFHLGNSRPCWRSASWTMSAAKWLGVRHGQRHGPVPAIEAGPRRAQPPFAWPSGTSHRRDSRVSTSEIRSRPSTES